MAGTRRGDGPLPDEPREEDFLRRLIESAQDRTTTVRQQLLGEGVPLDDRDTMMRTVEELVFGELIALRQHQLGRIIQVLIDRFPKGLLDVTLTPQGCEFEERLGDVGMWFVTTYRMLVSACVLELHRDGLMPKTHFIFCSNLGTVLLG